jgi:hypothetical protein
MTIGTHPPETDLWVPRDQGGRADPHTVHTHYFGFSIASANIGGFIYIRWQPAFPLAQGGVCVFQGLENGQFLDLEYLDFRNTMRWPTVADTTITVENGLTIEFLEPGRTAHITYASPDGATSIDLTQTALTPLLARGHVTPGEEQFSDIGGAAGGTEQFMHCAGELTLAGQRHAVECYAVRDRSWQQIRKETPGAVITPPVGWTPMYFGPDLVFNQISFEAHDTHPAWEGLFDMPVEQPSHHYAWIQVDGEVRAIKRIRRNVLAYHPELYAATKQEIEAEDETGQKFFFVGEAVAMAPIPAWPNAVVRDSVYRWEDSIGRVTHCTYQEMWFDTYQREMHRRRLSGALQFSRVPA